MNTVGTDPAPGYLEHYSLNSEPFSNQPDERFFYAGATLMQRLDLLTHLTQFGEALVVVSGPAGSGKTTLLRRFTDYANNAWLLLPFSAGQISQLAALLAARLGGDPQSDARVLVQTWRENSDDSELLVLLVDDADQLGPEQLLDLAALLGEPASSRVRLILFGDEDTDRLVKTAQERQQLKQKVQWLEVPRLSEEETASYLMYRLAVAGYSGESPFTATEVRAICKAGDGRPATINRLAHEALEEHVARSRSHRPGDTGVRRSSGQWAAGIAIVALAGVLGWQIFTSGPEQPATEAPDDTLEVPLQLPAPVQDVEEPPLPEPLPMTAEAPVAPAGAPDAEAPQRTDTLAGQVEAAPPDTTAATAAEPPPEPPAPATQAPATAEPAPLSGAVASAAAPVHVAATETPPAPQPMKAGPAAGPPQAQPPAGGEPPAADETARDEAMRALPHRERWLLAQPASRFTLQLLGSRSENSLKAYINRHRLDLEQIAYYKGRFKGGDWYVLLYGSYPDKQAALTARAGLPPKVRAGKPWPRSFGSVHKAIQSP